MRVGLFAILLLAAVPMAARADEPAAAARTGSAPPGRPQGDAAVRRDGPAPSAGIAARSNPERRRCRELASQRRLFGLGRHKFIQRCRVARRRGGDAPPAR